MLVGLIFVLLQLVAEVPGILVERRLADDLSLSIGDTLRASALGGATLAVFQVEGIFERAADPSRLARNEYEVRFHLGDLEALLPTHDRVDRFAVVLAPGASPASAARWIESLAFGTQVYETASLAEEASTTFRVVSRFHDAIGAVTLLASGLFLLCLMVIRVDERRADVRVLRLIGIPRRTVLGVVVLEAVGVAMVASLLGAALGLVLSGLVNWRYAAVYDTTLRFAIVTPQIVLLAIGLGIALGVAAGSLAALRLLRVPAQRLGER